MFEAIVKIGVGLGMIAGGIFGVKALMVSSVGVMWRDLLEDIDPLTRRDPWLAGLVSFGIIAFSLIGVGVVLIASYLLGNIII